MPCFDMQYVSIFEDGSRKFGLAEGAARYQRIPCGKCIGCERRKAVDWSTRLYLESISRKPSICVTLTYAPEHLPSYGSLRRADFTEFMKRLRRLSGVAGIKFHAIGEYSPAPVQRPHYHLSLFGVGPIVEGAKRFNTSKGGHDQYTAAVLDEAWRHRGLVTFQHYSPDAAAYVSSHEASKAARREFYGVDPATGKRVRLEDEFMACSKGKGGGIGRAFYDSYGEQLRAHDYVKVLGRDGNTCLPRFFDRITAEEYPEVFEAIKSKREAARLEREARAPLESQLDRLSAIEDYTIYERDRRLKKRTLG